MLIRVRGKWKKTTTVARASLSSRWQQQTKLFVGGKGESKRSPFQGEIIVACVLSTVQLSLSFVVGVPPVLCDAQESQEDDYEKFLHLEGGQLLRDMYKDSLSDKAQHKQQVTKWKEIHTQDQMGKPQYFIYHQESLCLHCLSFKLDSRMVHNVVERLQSKQIVLITVQQY